MTKRFPQNFDGGRVQNRPHELLVWIQIKGWIQDRPVGAFFDTFVKIHVPYIQTSEVIM